MGAIQNIVKRMEPEQAIAAIAGVLKGLFPLLGEEIGVEGSNIAEDQLERVICRQARTAGARSA
jgi:hypothetical protein